MVLTSIEEVPQIKIEDPLMCPLWKSFRYSKVTYQNGRMQAVIVNGAGMTSTYYATRANAQQL